MKRLSESFRYFDIDDNGSCYTEPIDIHDYYVEHQYFYHAIGAVEMDSLTPFGKWYNYCRSEEYKGDERDRLNPILWIKLSFTDDVGSIYDRAKKKYYWYCQDLEDKFRNELTKDTFWYFTKLVRLFPAYGLERTSLPTIDINPIWLTPEVCLWLIRKLYEERKINEEFDKQDLYQVVEDMKLVDVDCIKQYVEEVDNDLEEGKHFHYKVPSEPSNELLLKVIKEDIGEVWEKWCQ